jgi:glycogen debranching enzyme GlgX/4-alpha-glucanotransferase
MEVSEGAPEPLGATPDATGTNFAVHSAHATAIEVCLFDAQGAREIARVRLPERSGDVWHGHIAGVAPGARYGLRAHGPYAPEQGQRFNPAKLLLDPYAAAIDRTPRLHPTLFGYRRGAPEADLSHSDADSAPYMAKAIVCAPDRGPGNVVPLVPWDRTVIYELHVRGFTIRNPQIPEALRGTFAALAEPAAIAHLRALGVTSVEIMPCAAWIEERHLADLGLTNYWGYNPIAWMAPDPRLAPGGWEEVRAAVAALAAAGIETILDVVLNHSGEGDELGPTLSLRGLDNATYYRLREDGRFYVDDTACGNTLALDRPPVLRLAMDALRAWTRRAGVHGFRFDLATTLGRRADGFDPAAPLLSAIAQDPELRALKLIAEPWDPGPGGYQAGRFPHAWGEWNDRFRDAARRFWRGDPGATGELATRLAGSADLFGPKRRPSRSVNFIVAHDGFTLADLVSYAEKHNEANGEANRDGAAENFSWNHGVEGPSDDAAVRAARLADQRALLATLMLARGTPMLAMGAELGHSQGGNNNAYAQDNATTWLDWTRAEPGLTAFVGRLVALRREHPALRADRFLNGTPADPTQLPDVAWQRPDGQAMAAEDWGTAETLIAVFAAAGDRAALVLHRGAEAVPVTLPAPRDGHAWEIAIDSRTEAPARRLDAPTLICPARAALAVVEVGISARHGTADEAALLDRLADLAGIAPEWWDVERVRHPVSPDTKRALLAAMRLPAGTAVEARESLERFAETHQRRRLPHVLVARAGEAPLLTLAAEVKRLVIENEEGAQEPLLLAPEEAGETMCADGRAIRRWRARLPVLPVGRWRIWPEGRPDLVCALTVAPPTCYLPPDLAAGGRRFGLAAHLYSVRRAGDQGIGDFTTLAELGAMAARAGAAVVGLNPLHMLFPDRRERASPYHPSDRRFLDPIYIDVAGDEGGLDAPAARALLAQHAAAFAALAQTPLVDYPRVWAAKRAVLEVAFAAFDRDEEMAQFVAYGGETLRRFAAFQAIAEHFAGQDWHCWPEALRDPESPAVAEFAAAHAVRVRFHTWLQWLADRQFGAAAEAAGLSIGFYRDLAVGAAPDGAEAWAGARHLAEGASIGAPPDPFTTAGQVWGLPPPDPWRLRADGYRNLAGLLGANMRHAGALRIDHAMSLQRLFWVPDGGSGADGAYVAYPRDDLLGELALESWRARCLIVGEDLGTVPEGFRTVLAAADVLSYRVLWFERDRTGFFPPEHYPSRAVACVSTHDLPTLAGWREGADIAERAALGQIDAVAAWAERKAEQAALAAAIGAPPDAPAVHGFLAATPCALVLAQLDDLSGERDALNLPGTVAERPNWRRKLATAIPELLEAPTARAVLDRLRPGRTA